MSRVDPFFVMHVVWHVRFPGKKHCQNKLHAIPIVQPLLKFLSVPIPLQYGKFTKLVAYYQDVAGTTACWEERKKKEKKKGKQKWHVVKNIFFSASFALTVSVSQLLCI